MRITAIILAAGKGVRMNSSLPKPLHRLGGREMLAWAMDCARAAGARDIITVVPPDTGQLVDWLGKAPHVVQKNQRGTGDAAATAADAVKAGSGAALVMFADTPLVTASSLKRLADSLSGKTAIAVAGFRTHNPAGYGRIVRDENANVTKIVEHGDASPDELAIDLCNGGVMAVRLPLLFELLDAVRPATGKREHYLTDIVAAGVAGGHGVECVMLNESEILGVNDRQDLATAEAVLQERLRLAAMAGGVTMTAPNTVHLAPDAIIARDVVIEPNVVIGPGCNIAEGCHIRAFSHIEGATLGACCVIGPYARIRPGTNAGDGVRIGNFVEVKNTHMKSGAKANHLSYLGDAEIGIGANIGAGTITCNYDGHRKYKTLIDDGAFIGSNTALVAPVSIGARAIIGAGSTVTRDVAADSIAVARADLGENSGGATRFRQRRDKTKGKS